MAKLKAILYLTSVLMEWFGNKNPSLHKVGGTLTICKKTVMMKSLRKLTRKIIVVCCAFICLIIATFCFLLLNYYKKPKQITLVNKPNVEFCGTKNSEIAHEGKTIFNNMCGACHKLDANMTGPALRNIDSIVFNKWLNNKNYQINEVKINQFGIDYHLDFSQKNLKKSDLNMIYAYIGK